jgi:Domain of unknown function (DUF3806)
MPKIESINEKEHAWIKAQLENASNFVEGFSPGESGQPLTLAVLDQAFAAWVASEPTGTNLISAIINYLGIAFGQALVDGIGFQWIIATDDHGSDLAVHGLPGRGDILVYPVNFVAKRWERREINFLEDAYRKITHNVQEVLQRWQRAQPN